ncbi:hypothetical protein C1H46_013130 [Malus baccata]|uniref:RING-type E3 ubiquitin transferase n=1 Tax=Malus baccata TaxID=106549 RepID=A0A540MSL8_MALBA|nr:hypothetical protein C1H46_013130 [Malus baccata]
MSPGGRFFEDVAESHVAFADSDVATSTADLRASPFRKAAPGLFGNPGMPPNSNVHDLLECPVCMNLMCPPIHQCPNGHTLCSSCKVRVHNCCPTCRNELGNIRCLALEKVAESLDLPCRHQIYGCQDIFPYYSKLKHEKTCKYRPYSCPYAGAECSVTGDIQFLMMHLKNDHKFCLHFEAFHIGTAPVYMAFLRFMGDDDEAKQFTYSLEVSGSGRKLTWQGIPRSIRDSHRKVRDSQDGLIIQRNLALFFSGGNRQELKLKVAGRIWKEH